MFSNSYTSIGMWFFTAGSARRWPGRATQKKVKNYTRVSMSQEREGPVSKKTPLRTPNTLSPCLSVAQVVTYVSAPAALSSSSRSNCVMTHVRLKTAGAETWKDGINNLSCDRRVFPIDRRPTILCFQVVCLQLTAGTEQRRKQFPEGLWNNSYTVQK